MSVRKKGIRSPVSKGGVLMGRKLGAGRGDMQELSLSDLQALGIANHQTVVAAATAIANATSKNVIQNQGIIITNAAGESVTNP